MFSLAILNVFIAQLWLALLTHAAPIAEETLTATGHGNAWQYGTGGGILGLIVLVLDVIAFSKSFFVCPQIYRTLYSSDKGMFSFLVASKRLARFANQSCAQLQQSRSSGRTASRAASCSGAWSSSSSPSSAW